MTPERLEEIKSTAYWFDDVSTIGSLVRELIAAVPVWRPVSEMPKDGTLVIITNGEYSVPGFYWKGVWLDYDEDSISPPTHWQPLPAPPMTAAKEE